MGYGKFSSLQIDFKAIFETTPSRSILLLVDAPQFTIAAATHEYCDASGFAMADLVGKGVFEAFPPRPGESADGGGEKLRSSLAHVMQTGEPDILMFRYDVTDHRGGFSEKYWRTVNKPVFSNTGHLLYIMHSTEEISAELEADAQKKQLRDMKHVQNILMEAPFAIHIFKGDNLVVEMANEPTLKLWGKGKDVIGKSLFDIFPNVQETGFADELKAVMQSGKVQTAFEKPVEFADNEKKETRYYNYVFQPYYEDGNARATGVIAFVNNVTERVLTAGALKDVELRFQQIANTLPLVVWTASPDGNLTYISRQWETFYGNPVSESLGTGWASFVHPHDVGAAGADWGESLRTGENYETEFRVQHKTDGYHWILVRAVPIKNEAGDITAWYGSNTDIQENKKNEERLKAGGQEVRAIVESAPFPIGVYSGKEMRITLANQSILDVWAKGNDVIGKLYSEILPELDNQEIFQQLENVFETGIPFHAKNQRVDIDVDGKLSPFWFNYSFTPLFDVSGKVYGVMNTAADLTDLNLAYQKVDAGEKSIRATILKAPVAMCIFRGPNHVVEIANDRMMEIWGAAGREIINRPIFDVLPEAKDQGFEAILQNVYCSGEAYSAQDVLISLPRGGATEDVYVTFVFEAYHEAEGDVSGIIAVAIDVTGEVIARKKIQAVIAERTKELARANVDLQRSNAELAQFAYIASHDLQEPLRKISVFAQMLNKHIGDTGNIDAKTQSYLGKIDSSVGRMINLVRDVLMYSELSGQESRVFQPCNLQFINENIITDFELLIEQKKAKVELINLPVIDAIPLQMSQLFGNLVSNALKFMREDIEPLIVIRANMMLPEEIKKFSALNSGEPHYHIEVRDNGIGFSPEYAEQIFNIFQRLHGKSEYSGTGIGLAMCRKIVQNHNGYIFADSNEQGAVFHLLLPAKQVPVKQ